MFFETTPQKLRYICVAKTLKIEIPGNKIVKRKKEKNGEQAEL
jgi:hypothetical protein